MLRLPFDHIRSTLIRLFLKYGFAQSKAERLSTTFTESTLYGVNSHGVNRVGQFIDYINKGVIDIHADPECVQSMGSIERWEGHSGPGILNAIHCTERAVALAKQHGMGLVALRNTNHWMRGGSYGRLAADKGCLSILFTNTLENMPPWGGKESRVGNNPLVIGIPRAEGHVVLDMAMSLFSYGKMNNHILKGESLPFPGGWDENDELTTDPEAIFRTERALPMGYWKGSALSMVLDMLATLLSAGNSTAAVSKHAIETKISQVFFCIDQNTLGDQDMQERLLAEIINYTKEVSLLDEDQPILYPGERSARLAQINRKEGIPVDETVWNHILTL